MANLNESMSCKWMEILLDETFPKIQMDRSPRRDPRGEEVSRHTYHRADLNQQQIIDDLRQIGCNVTAINGAPGTPDLLVQHRGGLYLLEVKNKGGRLRESQKKFHSIWQGVSTVRNTKEACAAIGIQI